MDWKEYALLISALAAVGALTWNMYQNKMNREGRLKLRIRFVETFEIGIESHYTGRKVILKCTNAGIDTRIIETLGIRVDPPRGLSRYMQLHFVGALKDFNKRIERGEQQSATISASDLTGNPFCAGLQEGDSFKFFIIDTLNKKYFSNSLLYTPAQS